MKTKHLFIEFLIIFFIFVLPPLIFASKSDPHAITRLTFFSLVELAFCLLIIFQYRFLEKDLPEEEKSKRKRAKFIKNLYWWAIALGCLKLVYASLETCIYVFKIPSPAHTPLKISGAKWIFTITNICISALYEETLYRRFIPDCLVKFSQEKKIPTIIAEILSILIFAFSHRYLGHPAVINAAVCGTILRICCIKTNSIKAGTIAHAIYNFTLVLFSVTIT